ncbi:unnamed protein product [Fraxinus pennsylvanica]|uniref:Uncharacterized protein n=1 Tax=Fraxinus pennsylvanica TaxID=56036 RepID=A0AAD2E3W4_9LAMI|nr:unnamed protein product [Fraxinus pennsylvanica]
MISSTVSLVAASHLKSRSSSIMLLSCSKILKSTILKLLMPASREGSICHQAWPRVPLLESFVPVTERTRMKLFSSSSFVKLSLMASKPQRLRPLAGTTPAKRQRTITSNSSVSESTDPNLMKDAFSKYANYLNDLRDCWEVFRGVLLRSMSSSPNNGKLASADPRSGIYSDPLTWTLKQAA